MGKGWPRDYWLANIWLCSLAVKVDVILLSQLGCSKIIFIDFMWWGWGKPSIVDFSVQRDQKYCTIFSVLSRSARVALSILRNSWTFYILYLLRLLIKYCSFKFDSFFTTTESHRTLVLKGLHTFIVLRPTLGTVSCLGA